MNRKGIRECETRWLRKKCVSLWCVLPADVVDDILLYVETMEMIVVIRRVSQE